jgi:outer membrane receptor protein involved in Fe transport
MKTFSLGLFLFFIFGSATIFAAEYEIRIVDQNGAAIGGASVQIRQSNGNQPVIRAATDKEGVIRVNFTPPADIEVTANGFEALTRRVADAANASISLTLAPKAIGATVEVNVREAEDAVTTVGTALDIDRSGARTVFDAVEKLVPSAFVTRRGFVGYGIATNGTGQVFIRGLGEVPNAAILTVIDGRPDFQGLFGHPLPDFYSLSDAATIAVTTGPASVLYGSNAIGGVIEIKPERPSRKIQGELQTAFGSFRTGQHRARVGGAFERGFYHFTVGANHSDGDRPQSAYRAGDGTAAFGFDFTPRFGFLAEGRYGKFYVEDPGPLGIINNGRNNAAVQRGGFSFALNNTSEKTFGLARFFSSYGKNSITDGFRSRDRNTGFRLTQNYVLNNVVTFDGGFDYISFGGRARNANTNFNFGSFRESNAAGFGRAQIRPFDKLRFNGGLRYDHSSIFGGIVVPEFGAAINFNEKYSFSAQIARGFRNPTIRELYLFPAPNPNLKPEKLWNYQATLQARLTKNVLTWATGYYADLDNAIIVTGRFPALRLTNGGRAINKGFELNGRYAPFQNLSLQAGYAFLHSTNLPPSVPENKFNYAVTYANRRFSVDFGGIAVDSRFADARRIRKLGGYNVSTLKLSVPFAKRWNAFVVIDNLFDKRYQVVDGYPMPGITALAGLTLKFNQK